MTNEVRKIEVDTSATNNLPPRGDELIHMVIRFEYALKEVGHRRSGNKGVVEADWDSFSNCLTKSFFSDVQNANMAPTILSKPPSKQVIDGQILEWEPSNPPTNVQELFGAVRRTRNNLLHGGKSGDIDHNRNKDLVSESIAILLEALRADHALRVEFEGKY